MSPYQPEVGTMVKLAKGAENDHPDELIGEVVGYNRDGTVILKFPKSGGEIRRIDEIEELGGEL